MKTLYRYSKTGQFEGMIQCKESEISSVRRYTETAPPLNYNPVTQYPRWTGQKWELEEIPQPKDYFITDSTGQVVGISTLQPDETKPENHIEKTIETGDLYFQGTPRYYLKDGTITERTEAELFAILEATERETYRKAYCQREVRKLYTQDKEFQLQRRGILNPEDTEFVNYFNAIESIINNSKRLSIKEML